ncbi:histidinol-phosphate aminotransferase family protein [Allokutzneria sp. A3M-2-11 16]|uniref:pyridoxal phosphate-dependent aminotransferase n=1 Tax=Allokutzneria sp. A3M-2-11 16 TaxID=2962043 RepID=UPI0020B7E98E|nr:histidinol-phosphate transaminase [Allokutzneria sp. A3M-2-11 16]MCP3803135.1 histidinol-phosphate aminotransferase family protein [Allokutzneria sp. A3M-2-11 16]
MSFNASVAGADDLVRLHLSESPYGASALAVKAAERELTRVSVYPAPERDELVDSLARHWDLPADRIAVANGSDELVLATALTLGDRTTAGLVTDGTFPGYRTCLNRIGRGSSVVPLDGAGFVEQLPAHGIGYICNPHNPSGSVLSRRDMDSLVSAAERSGVPLVFDEAYMEFAGAGTPQARDYLDRDVPVLALRTFSKAYGLAALRIGYALGPAELMAELRETLRALPFSVNRLAQAAAVAALDDQEFLRQTEQANAETRTWFCDALDRRGRAHLPSVTNFVAVRVADPAVAQDRLAAEHGVLVRNAGLFGFPGYLRVSLGTREALTRFLDALDEVGL